VDDYAGAVVRDPGRDDAAAGDGLSAAVERRRVPMPVRRTKPLPV